MQNRLLVYPNGTKINIGNKIPFPAMIISTMIEGFNHVTYRVVWYDGEVRYDQWISESEIIAEERKKSAIIITGKNVLNASNE